MEFNDIATSRGAVTLFKAVDADLKSGRGLVYPLGAEVEPDRWSANGECGAGLHLCATPHNATSYFAGATRWLACRVKVSDLDLIRDHPFDKVKAAKVRVLHEVTYDGDKIAGAS